MIISPLDLDPPGPQPPGLTLYIYFDLETGIGIPTPF